MKIAVVKATENLRLGLSESDVKLAEGQVNELLTEIEKTIRLLEADIPANPASPKAERLEASLAKDMRAYFRDLSDALPWSDIEMLYYKLVKPE